MSYEKIEVEYRGNLAILRLNVPEKLNPLSTQMIEEINSALDTIELDARALILTGAGRAFCSGADLTGGLRPSELPRAPDFGRALETHVNPLLSRLRRLPIPWISVVRGASAGAGCSIALAGDLIVASETAYFLQAFSRIGLVPDGGSSYLLTRAIGRARASEMMLLAEKISAEQALDWGLINRVVPDDQLEQTGLELATRLANGPTATLAMTRTLCWDAFDLSWDGALAAERNRQRKVSTTHDAKEGIKAFVEKRPSLFKGN